jgi:aerobic C4-dicarboxylate transport protein
MQGTLLGLGRMGRGFIASPTARLLCALAAGALYGWSNPHGVETLRFLSEGFVWLIKLLAYPLVVLFVMHGIRTMGSAGQLRRLGLWALLVSEGLSLASLAFGMGVAWLLGTGLRLQDVLGPPVKGGFKIQSPELGVQPMLLVVALAVLLGLLWRRRSLPRIDLVLDTTRVALLRCLQRLVLLAPVPAFASVAILTAAYGHRVWIALADLLAGVYLASAAYIVLVLGTLCLACGTSLTRVLLGLKEELVLVVSTSASVSAMPGLSAWLEKQGCGRGAVRLLVPLNFTFGLNGSAIYLGFCLVALMQAAGLPLGTGDILRLLALAAITSKGACGVAGSAYMVLGMTLAALPGVPAEGYVLLFGIERLMKCRLVANLLAVAVHCLVVCTWCGQRQPAIRPPAMAATDTSTPTILAAK